MSQTMANMLTRDQLKERFPLVTELERRGVVLKGQGNQRTAKCPFHQDKNASFSVNVASQIWHCHAGCGGGSIVDLIAKFDGKPDSLVFKELVTSVEQSTPSTPESTAKPVIDTIYPYLDEFGREVYQAIRLKPKSFRQRHKGAKGDWVWNMEGVTRVLYRLPDVLKADTVWIVEGEKDADNLARLGYTATCNVGGAGKWLDSYTDYLTGKSIILCGDNDEPGQKHIDLVFNSIAGKVRNARRITLPKTVKDVSDFIAANPTTAKEELDKLVSGATIFTKGIDLPLYTMRELQSRYTTFAKSLKDTTVDLGLWLPGLRRSIRSLVPGELVAILADTGVGKTAIIQNIAVSQEHLPTVMFEMELPAEMIFERYIAMKMRRPQAEVEYGYAHQGWYAEGDELDIQFPNLLICDKAKMDPEKIHDFIQKSELKFGRKAKLALVDYAQLLGGKGKDRYEKVSNGIEDLKVVAKETGCVVIVTSQVTRKAGESPEVGLHDAKNSGSIEASSGLVLGAWRAAKDPKAIIIRSLKCTKGKTGPTTDIVCNFNGETLRIDERSPISDEDVPK